jgi:hypothetical protein
VSQQTTNRSFDDLARAMAEGSLSRRRALKLFAGTALAALIPSRALADDDDCVRVCHVPRTSTGACDFANARTRCVSRRERRRHLENHAPCDCRGSCANCLTPPCKPAGASCDAGSECCSGICGEGIACACIPDCQGPCTEDRQCCSGICDEGFGTCVAPGPGCL